MRRRRIQEPPTSHGCMHYLKMAFTIVPVTVQLGLSVLSAMAGVGLCAQRETLGPRAPSHAPVTQF